MNVRPERAHQLTRLSRAFTDARSLDEILTMAAEQAAALLGAERSVLMLTDEAGLLRVRASYGVAAATVERFQLAATDSLVSRLRGILGARLAHGFVGVPLVSQGRVVGLLATVRSDASAPTEDDEWVLSALADQVAAPLENARLAKQLERSVLLAENIRLYEAERSARIVAEAALKEAEVARDAAIHADTSKTSFLAAMSHELRTPLNAIAGYVELLEMGLRGPVTAEQIEDLRRIKASQAHLLRLITEVLDYARLGAGRADLSTTDVNLNASLHEAEVMLLPQIQARGLTYLFEPAPKGLTVRVDPQRLQQIVINLVSNAVKFTAPGGSISVTTTLVAASEDADAGFAEVRVTDTGDGIPADRMESIWQPFVQLGRRLNQPGEGVGLGLAISRDLARRLGGELTVESIVGEGSTFILTLPLAVPEPVVSH